MEQKHLYELRRVLRYNDGQEYPFAIKIYSRILFETFEEAEQAVKKMAEEDGKGVFHNVYFYGIYTLPLETELDMIDDKKVETVIYLPNGTLWAKSKMQQRPMKNGDICEYVSEDQVYPCLIEDACYSESECGYITWDTSLYSWRKLTDFLPCSIPVPDGNIAILKSKYEGYKSYNQNELFVTMGVPYPAECLSPDEMDDMNDFLHIPSSFSGYKYDLFFDCKSSYRKNMHPLWLYVAYPHNGRVTLIPITASNNPAPMYCEKYEDLANVMLLENEDLQEFIYYNLKEILKLADECISAECFMINLIKMDVFSTGKPTFDPWDHLE